MAADCPEPPKKRTSDTARMIEHGSSTESDKPQDPWILTVSASEDKTGCTDGVLPRQGPTRALLDPDAQISLVRQ